MADSPEDFCCWRWKMPDWLMIAAFAVYDIVMDMDVREIKNSKEKRK